MITCNYVLDSKKKPEISYPTQFEHTIHVGFDPVTSEFTVSRKLNVHTEFYTRLSLETNSIPVIVSCLPVESSIECFEVASLLAWAYRTQTSGHVLN